MVRIRLRRVGRKKQPSYRIVVADQRSPRDGRYIEIIGFYNPRTDPSTMTVKEDRALHWLSVGAQPSEAVHRILNKLGTLGRYERLTKGEDLEALLAEAAAEEEAREPISPKTMRPAKPKTAAVAEKAEEAQSAGETETPAVEESEAPAEDAVEEPAEESVEDSAEETEAAE